MCTVVHSLIIFSVIRNDLIKVVQSAVIELKHLMSFYSNCIKREFHCHNNSMRTTFERNLWRGCLEPAKFIVHAEKSFSNYVKLSDAWFSQQKEYTTLKH